MKNINLNNHSKYVSKQNKKSEKLNQASQLLPMAIILTALLIPAPP